MVSAPGRLTGIFILVLQPAFFRRRGHGDGGCERRSGGGDRAAGFASVQGRFHACDARCVRMVRLRAYDGFQLALLARSLFRRDPIRGATRHRRRNRSGRRRDHLDFLSRTASSWRSILLRCRRLGSFMRALARHGVFGSCRFGHDQPVHSRPVGVRVLAGDDAP